MNSRRFEKLKRCFFIVPRRENCYFQRQDNENKQVSAWYNESFVSLGPMVATL